MKGCRLCGRNEPLQVSHIIPRFVTQWMKQTGTPFLLDSRNLALREQDGLKIRLLCRACEGRFSRWEHQFARLVFHPYLKTGKADFDYGPWLLQFARSLSWRFLAYKEELGFLDVMSGAVEAMTAWSSLLLADENQEDCFEHHLVVQGPALNAPPDLAGIHAYMERTYSATVSWKLGLTLIRLPMMGVASTFRPAIRLNSVGTRIHTQGQYVLDAWRMEDERYDLLHTQLWYEFRRAEAETPPTRVKAVHEWRHRNQTQWQNSLAYQTYQKDAALAAAQNPPASPREEHPSGG